jgi:hypothetical protein
LPPSTSAPSRAPSRERRIRKAPRVLLRGITTLNQIRLTAAEAVVRRGGATGNLAPASAWRKKRGEDGYAFTAAYHGATGVLHQPAWVLPSLDSACAQALMAWALAMVGDGSSPPNPPSPDPELKPVAVVLIGAIAWQGAIAWEDGQASVTLGLLVQHAVHLGLSSNDLAFLRALARHPKWRARIRRCEYDAGRREGCYRYFIDQSPAGTATACSRAHAVRLIEARGARSPHGPRGPAPR